MEFISTHRSLKIMVPVYSKKEKKTVNHVIGFEKGFYDSKKEKDPDIRKAKEATLARKIKAGKPIVNLSKADPETIAQAKKTLGMKGPKMVTGAGKTSDKNEEIGITVESEEDESTKKKTAKK